MALGGRWLSVVCDPCDPGTRGSVDSVGLWIRWLVAFGTCESVEIQDPKYKGGRSVAVPPYIYGMDMIRGPTCVGVHICGGW